MYAIIENMAVHFGTHTEQLYVRKPCDDFRCLRELSEDLGHSSEMENVPLGPLSIRKTVEVVQTFRDYL